MILSFATMLFGSVAAFAMQPSAPGEASELSLASANSFLDKLQDGDVEAAQAFLTADAAVLDSRERIERDTRLEQVAAAVHGCVASDGRYNTAEAYPDRLMFWIFWWCPGRQVVPMTMYTRGGRVNMVRVGLQVAVTPAGVPEPSAAVDEVGPAQLLLAALGSGNLRGVRALLADDARVVDIRDANDRVVSVEDYAAAVRGCSISERHGVAYTVPNGFQVEAFWWCPDQRAIPVTLWTRGDYVTELHLGQEPLMRVGGAH